ncbi:MAG: YesL family protein [Clostridia bacterium]|nr:YesL family protein [Clostridia bacterium]
MNPDNKNKKHRIYNFFSGTENRSGRGVTKKQVEHDKQLGFAYFFKLLKMRLGKLALNNLIFALCNIPLFIALLGVAGYFNGSVNTASDPLYGPLYGIMQYENNPVTSALFGVYGAGTELTVVSAASKVLMCFAFLLLITFGLSSIGMIYNIRNVCRGESIYTWGDFFEGIKKNFKQGLAVGIIDFLIIALLVYDIMAYSANSANSFMMLVFYYASILFAAIYYIMRYYLYIQLVTCRMSIGKMFKNSFLLTALGIKRNLAGFVGALLFAVAFVYFYILFPSVAIILLGIFVFSFLAYIGVYCAYPVVEKYVIEPYYEEHPDERPGYGEESFDEDTEQIFTDEG